MGEGGVSKQNKNLEATQWMIKGKYMIIFNINLECSKQNIQFL